MKLLPLLAAGASVAMLATVNSWSHPSSPQDSDFRLFLRDFEDSTRRFINGDAEHWKRHASHREDVTIMGGFGGYEKGWQEVAPRYDWAAARFRESGAGLEVEYLAATVSGNLAYTVGLERSQVRVVGHEQPQPMVLRVTHVFRNEDGKWKLVHRHADQLAEKAAPSTVPKK
jgi:ketosteroid isomerase-like protein